MEGTIEDVLKQLKLRSTLEKPKYTHNILPLFQFPRLEATLTTLQHYSLYSDEPPTDSEGRRICGVVESSFISEFADPGTSTLFLIAWYHRDPNIPNFSRCTNRL